MGETNLNNSQTSVEAEWTAEIMKSNADAFEKLFNFYCQPLLNFSRRYVLDKQIAENIVQDIFVKIWTNRSALDPGKSIKSYLFTSVKNESLKHLRHLDVEQRGAEKLITSAFNDNSPDINLNTAELEELVEKAIKELPEKCREIFAMSRFDNLKYSEIALILNISVKTVETQMGRALKKLRDRLKPFLVILLAVTSTVYLFM